VLRDRLRHGSTENTLDTYGHLWPAKDQPIKAVIDAVVDKRLGDPPDCEGHAVAYPQLSGSKYYTS
jgi:hypothetical protein